MKGKHIILILFCLLSVTSCGKKNNMEITENPVETETFTTQITTTEKEEETTEEIIEAEPERENPRNKILIAIDPGHQGSSVDMSALEANAPGSGEMKMKATTGTAGTYTGVPEYELNLTISGLLREELEGLGYNVIMTREDNDTAISNAERATLANDAGADISVRIHANGSEDSSTNGALVLIGSENNPYVGSLYTDSYRLGEAVLNSYCGTTGMKNLGIQTNDTMTGINWSRIPVIILEMGFMTNQMDDENMENADYQRRMVSGIAQGIDDYFGIKEETVEKASDSLLLTGLQQKIEDAAKERIANGDLISVYVENLTTGEYAETGSGQFRAASLIKLYIAGCFYEEQQNSPDSNPEETGELIKQMITVSDNDAANTIVKKLGNGDAAAGMEKVNRFCTNHGLTDSHMGRLMLDFSSPEDNYTSVQDSAAFLRSLYQGRLAGSDKMLAYLKQQTRTTKLPAGIPEGVETANKTGELDNVENDAAIIFAGEGPYVISVMADGLSDTAATKKWITELSRMVYEYFTTES